MGDFIIFSSSKGIDPRERAKRLSRVFQLIMSWKLPEQQSATPDDLERKTGIAEEEAPSNEDTVN